MDFFLLLPVPVLVPVRQFFGLLNSCSLRPSAVACTLVTLPPPNATLLSTYSLTPSPAPLDTPVCVNHELFSLEGGGVGNGFSDGLFRAWFRVCREIGVSS
ncbi:unnamed protein product [Sphacelaria rigidula]